jgi:hypothetical protein
MSFGLRRSGALVGALAASALLAGANPAQASPDTLRRAVANLLQAPLDLVLAPVVAGRTLVNNLRDVDDTMGVRVAYAVPGYAWLCGVQVGSAVLRGVAGGLELVPGVLLLPLETDLDPLYDPADRGRPLVELENPLVEDEAWQLNPFVSFNVRFGVTYTSAEY